MVDRYVKNQFIIDCFHTAFSFTYQEDFVFKGEMHDFWEINYITSGTVTVTNNERVMNLGSGDMIIHAPMVFHRIKSANGTKPKGYTTTFHTRGKLPMVLENGLFHLDLDDAHEFEKICEAIIPFVNNEESDSFYGQLVSSKLSAFLIHLANGATMDSHSVSTSANEYRRVVSFMKETVCEGLQLSLIAKKCNISLSYLKLLFSMYAGLSPKSYYDTLRANKAAFLLSLGHSVNEVAGIMNFSSTNYFSTFFKRCSGESPLTYKKKTFHN